MKVLVLLFRKGAKKKATVANLLPHDRRLVLPKLPEGGAQGA